MHSLSAFLLSLPVVALAGHGAGAHRRHHHARAADIAARQAPTAYTLEDDYSGPDFFKGWTFFTDPDPTSGQVNYLSQSDAQAAGLAFVQSDNTTKIGVDSTTQLQPGQPRNSVRIQTVKTYDSGLFIADFFAMPHGCSVWPAYWTVGGNWPNDGEVDIIEGVNQNVDNQITLHTGPSCVMSESTSMLGSLVGNTCTSSNGANAGCAVVQSGNNSFGHPFNEMAGGVFAHLWTNESISFWFFPRNQIPSDITSMNPNPDSWGTPVANFPTQSSCDISQHFAGHQIVLDTTLCGDWAGAAFSQDGCPGSCSDFVADPSNFQTAQWAISSIRVYQPSGSQ
ncbi:glycoside hydrolase family 16 protein [Phanerochaete carnosa HHB-10118-sp]|uniref:Glycoside hydrolase family 16 protein n=1 Tax=Phanerochaete carnosa (strain HHB-10118-sp) TaxID=650164 RepID=K5VVQ3_PHACS|nr:glycoside hydrolase family 16 protein [Phanerochaete carnosa HHB-10118-sp]EKM50659.1 glycoside hydrolase family 16 protein [Phanerochaete carnosa HHB-10118-sp]